MTNREFESFMKQYEKLVFTICFQLVRDYGEAQNLTQETFLSAYSHIESCDAKDYKPWLARIASNKAKDYLKSAYFRRVRLDIDEENSFLDTGQSPDDIIRMTEDKMSLEGIKEQVLSLKEPYKAVSQMYFLEEKTTEEISGLLGRPQKTVQTQLYRAKLILRDLLKEGTG